MQPAVIVFVKFVEFVAVLLVTNSRISGSNKSTRLGGMPSQSLVRKMKPQMNTAQQSRNRKLGDSSRLRGKGSAQSTT